VEREGQKGILIGAHGAMIKRVGTHARHEMQRLFGTKIFLDLRVKVQSKWRDKAAFLDSLDWRTMAGKEHDS
jgi:GTPase